MAISLHPSAEWLACLCFNGDIQLLPIVTLVLVCFCVCVCVCLHAATNIVIFLENTNLQAKDCPVNLHIQ